MTRPVAFQAISALRVAAGGALDAHAPAIPLILDGEKADPDTLLWWVEESVVGGESEQAECGPPDPANVRDQQGQIQLLIFGPRDSGYFAFRGVAESIEAALVDVPLTLDDNDTPVIVLTVTIGALRAADDHGKESMPVVVLYETLAPRVVPPAGP